MQDNTRPVIGQGRTVELSEHSSFMSEQSQAKNNKSGRSGNLTPTRDGKNGKPSIIVGHSPNRNDTSNIKNKLQ